MVNKSYAYRAELLAQSRLVKLRKGVRTEIRIRWAACELLESTALDAIKVIDICTWSEIAQGTIYQYFRDRDSLLERVLQDFVGYLKEQMLAAASDSAGYEDSVRVSTATYAKLFSQNRGLMKCLLNHYEAFPRARSIFRELNRDWIGMVVASVRKRRAPDVAAAATSEAELMRRANALGGMVDQYLASIFIDGDEPLAAVAGSMDEIVDTLTFIWLQAFRDQFEVQA